MFCIRCELRISVLFLFLRGSFAGDLGQQASSCLRRRHRMTRKCVGTFVRLIDSLYPVFFYDHISTLSLTGFRTHHPNFGNRFHLREGRRMAPVRFSPPLLQENRWQMFFSDSQNCTGMRGLLAGRISLTTEPIPSAERKILLVTPSTWWASCAALTPGAPNA